MSATSQARRSMDEALAALDFNAGVETKQTVRSTGRRNPYFDALRGAALLRVLTFHLFGWAWLPLVFPSMGIMFALAGSLMAASLDRTQKASTVVRRRLRRLLPPLWALGAVLVPVMLWTGWTTETPGTQSPGLSLLSWIVPITEPPGSDLGYEWTLPLWYLRTYLWLVLLSPPLLWLWRHFPKAMMLLPLLGLLLFSGGWLRADGPFSEGLVSLLTYAACWMLGFAHHDGKLQFLRIRVVLLIGALLCTFGLWWAWRYPLPDSGFTPGDIPLAAAFYSLGFAAVLMRLPIKLSFLDRMPFLRSLLDMVNQRAITIYAWGNLAIFLALALMDRAPVYDWLPGAALQPASLMITLLLLGVIVLMVGWVEDVAAGRSPRLIPISGKPQQTIPQAEPAPNPPAAPQGPARDVPRGRSRPLRGRRKTGLIVAWSLSLVLVAAMGLVVAGKAFTPRTSEFDRCVSPMALMGDLNSSSNMREVAQMLVGSAENSSLYWEDHVSALQYNVEGSDQWNRGYTGGIIGFTSRTSSMLEVVQRYDALRPGNPLSPFLPALQAANGTASIAGLGTDFERAWAEAAGDRPFLDAQLGVARDWYLDPALAQAAMDGLQALGQFFYYDAMIQHGVSGFEAIHQNALLNASPPAAGGDETRWLQAWLDARESYMTQEVSEVTATRVTTAQQGLLDSGNLKLRAPLSWDIYGDHFDLQVAPFCSLG